MYLFTFINMCIRNEAPAVASDSARLLKTGWKQRLLANRNLRSWAFLLSRITKTGVAKTAQALMTPVSVFVRANKKDTLLLKVIGGRGPEEKEGCSSVALASNTA